MEDRHVSDNISAVGANEDTEKKGTPKGSAADGSAEVEPRNAKKKQHKRVVSSISRRTTLNYIIYSILILAMLWAVFFVVVFGFYDTILKRDIAEIGKSASSAVPNPANDDKMNMYFQNQLPEIARDNTVTIVVFTRDEYGNIDVRTTVDNLGTNTDENTDVFDAVMDVVSFDSLFTYSGASEKASTRFGTYMCYGSSHELENESGEKDVIYLLVIKPYEVINPQTNKIIYILIICTMIVLVLTCIFSYFASRFQTKQLIDFSQKAKRLADGDYGVVFSGDGYDELESLAGALNAATEKVQQTEKLQRDIIANISHDIRTPLTMIRAYAEMLRDMPVEPEKRKKTADVIISETDRLTALTDDVLSFSRLQSGVAEFKFEQWDISQTARSVLKQFDIYRERDGMKFLTDIDKKAVAVCDKHRIEQVLYNLIINAINYCGDDKTVIIRVKSLGGKVRVEVTDNGKGIEKDELDSVWDRYYRSAHSKRTTVGSGLGLSICKNILVAHDAGYGVISELGKGSTFWFELKHKDKRQSV